MMAISVDGIHPFPRSEYFQIEVVYYISTLLTLFLIDQLKSIVMGRFRFLYGRKYFFWPSALLLIPALFCGVVSHPAFIGLMGLAMAVVLILFVNRYRCSFPRSVHCDDLEIQVVLPPEEDEV